MLISYLPHKYIPYSREIARNKDENKDILIVPSDDKHIDHLHIQAAEMSILGNKNPRANESGNETKVKRCLALHTKKCLQQHITERFLEFG